MPLAYIKCPNSGFLVSTNHIVPDDQALHKPEQRHIAIPCPFCGEDHIWDETNGLFLSISDNNPSEQFGQKTVDKL